MSLFATGGPIVRDAHIVLAWFVVIANGVVGAWALAAHRSPALRSPWLWRATAVAEISILIQVMVGVAVISGRDTEPYGFHMFYGFVAAFTVAIVYSYRAQLRGHWYLLYGFGGLFLMGLGIRAMVLHPV